MKKTLHGKRHIRSRTKQIKTYQRQVDGLGFTLYIKGLDKVRSAIDKMARDLAESFPQTLMEQVELLRQAMSSYVPFPSNSDKWDTWITPEQRVKELIEKAEATASRQLIYYDKDWNMITPND